VYEYDELRTMYDEGYFSFEGEIKEEEWLQILRGILDSPKIDDSTKDWIRPLL
jgi:hypothetical protein